MSFFEITGPCESLPYGEIEDYCVFVEKLPDCVLDEIVLDTLGVGKEDAIIFWNKNLSSNNYTYRYRVANDAEWITGVVEDTIVILTGLQECMSYEFQVSRNCENEQSEYSDTLLFETDCSSSLELIAHKEVFRVYPNPFEDELKIQLGEQISSPVIIRMFNSEGLLIIEKTIENTKATMHPGELIVKDLEDGIYFLKFITSKGNYIRKIIKTSMGNQ
jgi:hypothetical protein